MRIELYYKYSELDNEPQFGVVIENKPGYEIYVRWVYYYLGAYLGVNRPTIYPFAHGKLVKSYKNCNDAKRQGILLYNRINKILIKEKK